MMTNVATYAGRAVLSVAVLYLAWSVLPILRPDRTTEEPTAEEQAKLKQSQAAQRDLEVISNPYLLSEMLAGHWNFNDAEWAIATSTMKLDEARARMEQPPEGNKLTDHDLGNANGNVKEDDKLLRLFEGYGSKTILETGFIRYHARFLGIEAVGFALPDGNSARLVKASGIMQDRDGNVQLLEVRRPTTSLPGPDAGLTMALPEGTELLAIRRDGRNRTCATVAENDESTGGD